MRRGEGEDEEGWGGEGDEERWGEDEEGGR